MKYVNDKIFIFSAFSLFSFPSVEFIILLLLVYLLAQDGDTALMSAAAYGQAGVVTLLVNRGANLDLKNRVSKPYKALTLFCLIILFSILAVWTYCIGQSYG